jgi:threonylcarbamoyladenosine tRNA methylthiotransferase MtaB
MNYAIVTFGCRVNQADSLAVEEQLLERGLSPAAPDHADVVVVNTCSVTAAADQGARQTIRRIARVNPSARIVVTGCYATRAPEELRQLPQVLRIVPNSDKGGVGTVVDECLTTAERFGDGEGACGAAVRPGVAGRTAFTLRVETGCAEACSYCIIPRTRGQPLSLPLTDVLQSVERAAAAGFKEVALTGVHLGSYGRDLTPARSLLELLRELAAMFPGLLFRISSLEPMDCPAELVELVGGHACFAPHFHLPLQHASDEVLVSMRRPYTLAYYASLVDRIRYRIADASISSDIIVGFPGETVQDFECLTRYLEHSPLTHLHVFPYSDRPGTAASRLPRKIDGRIVRERAGQVRAISERLQAAFRERQIGRTHRALTLGDGSTALTGNYLKLRIPEGRARNEWVSVTVRSHHDGELLAG